MKPSDTIPNIKPNIPFIRKKMKECISDDDLRYYFGNEVDKYIIKYSDLQNYHLIEQLLPKKKDFKIILLEDKFNSGHWVLLMRKRKNIEFFNSYGSKPSAELDLLIPAQKEFLGENIKWLNILLTKALKKFNIYYNTFKFQADGDNVNTYGRHMIFRLIMFLNFNLNLKQYIRYVKLLCNHFKLNLDELVSMLVNENIK